MASKASRSAICAQRDASGVSIRRISVDRNAPLAARHGVDLLLEPINTRDIPRFFLNRQDHAHEIVEAVGAPNAKVQMDLYHCQIVEGDVAMKIRKYLPTGRVGHFQIAGVPQRFEPDVGELNHDYLFEVIDEVSAACGWSGVLGARLTGAGFGGCVVVILERAACAGFEEHVQRVFEERFGRRPPVFFFRGDAGPREYS